MKQHHGLWLFAVIGALMLAGTALTSCAPDTSAPELNTEARVDDLVTPTHPVEVAQADLAGQCGQPPSDLGLSQGVRARRGFVCPPHHLSHLARRERVVAGEPDGR